MRDVSRAMWYHLGVIGTALALSLGSMALAGCGSSGEGASDTAADAASTDTAEPEETDDASSEETGDESAEETEEDLTQHWFQTLNRRHVQSQELGWMNPGERSLMESDEQVSYEIDEHGNVTKSITTTTYAVEGYEEKTEEVREFTIDEKGWPQSVKVTRSNVSHAVGYELVEGTDEDGNPVESYQPVDDGESLETAEPIVDESTATFTYERDDKGRVVECTSDDPEIGSFEVTYQDDGKIATFRQVSTYDLSGLEEENATRTYDYTYRYNEKGKLVESKNAMTDGDGTTETVTEYDGNDHILKETTTITDPDGAKHELVMTYDFEKDDQGNLVKTTCTVSGDGEGSRDRYVGTTKRISETFGSDGSITAAEITLDETFEEVESEAATYEGPYSVSERTFDDKGNVLTAKTVYYDGTTMQTENTYDEDGNVTKMVQVDVDGVTSTTVNTYDDEGNQLSSVVEQADERAQKTEFTYEWKHVEEPSEYAGTFYQHTWL